MRLLAVSILLWLSAAVVGADVAVLRPGPGGQPAGLAAARAAADRVERYLEFGGLDAVPWTEDTLNTLTPARAPVLIVPGGTLSPEGSAAAERYVAAGGRIILFAAAEAPALLPALGVTVGEPDPGAFTGMRFASREVEALPGLPAQVPLAAAAPRKLILAEGTRALGHWRREDRQGPPAVVLSPRGAYVNAAFGLGEPLVKGWLLQALVAALDESTAARSVAIFRQLAATALEETADRWSRGRTRSGLDVTRAERIDRELSRLRLRVAAAPRSAATPEERVAAVRRIQESILTAQSLRLQMAPSPPVELRGAWIHTYSPTDWDTVMAKLARHGFNSIFVRVGRGGNVIYPSALLPRDAWAERAGGDEMKRAIDAAHRHGLRFHAWRVNFHMRSAPREYYEKMAAEDRLVRGPDGKQAHWANPADPRNAELEFRAMVEMARNYDVDGVHFDYIRYPDEPIFDYDYGPVSRREFEKVLGRPVAEWPRDVLSGPLKTRYEAWERENIDRLVERVAREVRRIRPEVRISAAVWRNHRYWRPIIKQDWPGWIEKGWLDFAVPMDYTAEQETFAQTVDLQVAATRGRVPLMAGIGNWLLFTPEEVVQQVESARAAGAAGFVLFAYNAEQIDEHLRALAAGATSQPAAPSDRVPRARLSVPGTIARRDAPPVLLAGATQTARLEPNPAGMAGPASAEWVIESPEGQRLISLGPVSLRRPSGARTFKAPAGRWRPALRGTWPGGSGPATPFAVLGPVVEGVEARELAALRARETPGPPAGATRPIAIYAYGLGADRLREALEGAGGTPYLVYGLSPSHLKGAEVLILPQLQDVLELTPAIIQGLRAWVEGGGTIVLTHDAVGARWHPRLFPEVGEGGSPKATRVLEIATALPGLERGARIEHAFVDHVPLTLAQSAEVLAREPAPSLAPVVARGKAGRGTVILMGTLPGGGGGEITEGERALLRAVVAR